MPNFNLFAENIPDSLKTFRAFEIVFSVICIIIPFILKLLDITNPVFRPSISAYFDINNSYLFGMLLSIPAMLFIFNGAVFFRGEFNIMNVTNAKWYNVILGTALFGVISFNCKDHNSIHTIFASIFFFGNAVVMMFFHDKDHLPLRIILSLLTVISLLLGAKYFSIFWGEWLSLTVIGIHFILVAEKVISYAASSKSPKIN